MALGDGVADGVDAGAVLRREVAGLLAERLRHVAGPPAEVVEPGELSTEQQGVDRITVHLDVAAGEHVGVAGGVDRGHVHAELLERLGHSGRAGEQIQCRLGVARRGDLAQHRDEAALRSQVLDHR